MKEAINAEKPIGDGQCVSACSNLSGVTNHTDAWTPGRSMTDLTDKDLGLAVASLGPDDKYKQRDGDQNSAIYMGHNKNGRIQVVDQWPYNPGHQSPNLHSIENYGPSGIDSQGRQHTKENNAYYYHVIIVK